MIQYNKILVDNWENGKSLCYLWENPKRVSIYDAYTDLVFKEYDDGDFVMFEAGDLKYTSEKSSLWSDDYIWHKRWKNLL